MPTTFRTLALAAAAATLAACATPPAPRVERWTAPPVGASWETAQRNTGSYGADARVQMTRMPDADWNGRRAVVFANARGGGLRLDPETGRWFAMVAPGGAPFVSFEPPLGWLFPLEPGKEWTTRHRMTLHAANRSIEYDLNCKVEAFEPVTVAAGTFDAVRIGCRTTIDNTETYWTSPDLGIFLKSRLVRGPANPLGAGTQETELVTQAIRR